MAAIDNFNSAVSVLETAISTHVAAVDAHIAAKANVANVSESVIQSASDKVNAIAGLVSAETTKLNASVSS